MNKKVSNVYRRRWYILVLFTFLAFIQNLVWNTWGPISSSAKTAFHWTETDISLFPNWGTICFIIFVIPFSWLINTKGLRTSILLSSFLITSGSLLRCLTSEPIKATWLINIGHILNGISGPIICAVPSALSAAWFPEHERTTATAVGISGAFLGLAFSFFLGPVIVSQPDSFKIDSDHSILKHEIMNLMYLEFGLAGCLFFLCLLYFPDKPPRAPTISASCCRYDFRTGFHMLFWNSQFWFIGLSLGLFNGVYFGCIAILTSFLETKEFTQKESGYLGFYSLIVGQIVTLCISRYLDGIKHGMKFAIILLKLIYFGILFWLLLLWKNIIASSKLSIYIIYITAGICNFSSVPIYYELAIESLYPTDEGVITGFLNMFVNAVMTVMLFFDMFISQTNLGKDWIIHCLLGSVLTSFPFLYLFKENYNRLKLDESETIVDSSSPYKRKNSFQDI